MNTEEDKNLYITAIKLFNQKNYKEAIKFFEQASELNCSEAMFVLGNFYEEGLIPYINQDIQKAKELYKRAAELGNSDAMFNLGQIFHYIDKNYPEAKKYYEQADESLKLEKLLKIGGEFNDNSYKKYTK